MRALSHSDGPQRRGTVAVRAGGSPTCVGPRPAPVGTGSTNRQKDAHCAPPQARPSAQCAGSDWQQAQCVHSLCALSQWRGSPLVVARRSALLCSGTGPTRWCVLRQPSLGRVPLRPRAEGRLAVRARPLGSRLLGASQTCDKRAAGRTRALVIGFEDRSLNHSTTVDLGLLLTKAVAARLPVRGLPARRPEQQARQGRAEKTLSPGGTAPVRRSPAGSVPPHALGMAHSAPAPSGGRAVVGR